MKIFVGADHNGFQYKAALVSFLQQQGYDVVDAGDEKLNQDDDFPVFARKVVMDMQSAQDPDPRGILICGSGQGMCMAANRHKGIRAALGYDQESVRSARNDDNANVLCLGVRTLQADKDYDLVETFLKTEFANALRFSRRIKELDEL